MPAAKIRNPKTGRMVLKSGVVGKSIKRKKSTGRKIRKVLKKTTKGSKRSAPKIRNPKTGRMVLKSGTLGRKISSKKKTKTKTRKVKKTSSRGAKYVSQSGRIYTNCWSGYKRQGWKMKNGRRVPNCVKA